jgi:hypothetical protein
MPRSSLWSLTFGPPNHLSPPPCEDTPFHIASLSLPETFGHTLTVSGT